MYILSFPVRFLFWLSQRFVFRSWSQNIRRVYTASLHRLRRSRSSRKVQFNWNRDLPSFYYAHVNMHFCTRASRSLHAGYLRPSLHNHIYVCVYHIGLPFDWNRIPCNVSIQFVNGMAEDEFLHCHGPRFSLLQPKKLRANVVSGCSVYAERGHGGEGELRCRRDRTVLLAQLFACRRNDAMSQSVIVCRCPSAVSQSIIRARKHRLPVYLSVYLSA